MNTSVIGYSSLLFFVCCMCACHKVANTGLPSQNIPASKTGSSPSLDTRKEVLLKKVAIKIAFLEDLGLRGKVTTKDFGACFILVDEDELEYFTSLFEGNIPRVELSCDRDGKFKNLVTENGAFLDRLTKKQGVIYGFQKLESTNDHAEAEVIESFGMLGANIHTYILVRQNGKWIIRSHSRQPLS